MSNIRTVNENLNISRGKFHQPGKLKNIRGRSYMTSRIFFDIFWHPPFSPSSRFFISEALTWQSYWPPRPWRHPKDRHHDRNGIIPIFESQVYPTKLGYWVY